MFIAKLGNNLFNVNETTNVKWLYAFFINNDWTKRRQNIEMCAKMMQKYGKGLNPWIMTFWVTTLFYSTFCGYFGLRNTNRLAPVFVVSHFCQRHLDLFEQWLFMWAIADMLLPGAAEQAEECVWNRAAQHGSQYVGAKPAETVLKTNSFISRIWWCWSLCSKVTANSV